MSDRTTDHLLAAVTRPAFVAAVGVLLVNDHLLKGAGLLPAAVTGKLSDVAGLFFFPVLLTVLVGLLVGLRDDDRIRRVSAAAAFATAGVFGLVNLTPALAATLSDTWGTWTADPTDLACLPLVVAGHLWLVRHLDRRGASTFRSTARTRRLAMVGLAAAASLATSKPTPTPEAEIQNTTDDSLSFVDSPAQLVYRASDARDNTLRRIGIDGSEDTEIAPVDYRLGSMSHSGDTIALIDESTIALYRDDTSNLLQIPSLPDEPNSVLVSPNGDTLAATTYRRDDDDNYLATIHLADPATAATEPIKSDIRAVSPHIGYTADGSTLYARANESTASSRFSLAERTWQQTEPDSVDWESLHRPHYEPEHTCRTDDGQLELRDPWDGGDADNYDGLRLHRPDGSNETLVDIEITEDLDDDTNYSSPFKHYFFLRDCEYVVFQLSETKQIRVVDLATNTVGTIAEGRGRVVPVPKYR
jgi:hypothetical protein